MFWDKKKSSLPDLPRSPMLNAPSMGDYNQEDYSNELPSFPDSPIQKGFSQSAIKDAVSSDEPENMDENQDQDTTNTRPMIQEYSDNAQMEEWKPQVQAIPQLPRSIPSAPRSRHSDSTRPVFIRLDKFQMARSSLENVKTKLTEIEDLLKQIRDVKAKEDQELAAWETDIESVKRRLETITTEVFDRGEE